MDPLNYRAGYAAASPQSVQSISQILQSRKLHQICSFANLVKIHLCLLHFFVQSRLQSLSLQSNLLTKQIYANSNLHKFANEANLCKFKFANAFASTLHIAITAMRDTQWV